MIHPTSVESPNRFEYSGKRAVWEAEEWLRGLDSNQDSQLQRLVSYQLDDPGVGEHLY